MVVKIGFVTCGLLYIITCILYILEIEIPNFMFFQIIFLLIVTVNENIEEKLKV